MCAKYKFDYDSEEDLLYIYDPAKRSKGSVEFAELVVDLEKAGKVIGVEIFDASKYLSDLTGVRITKAQLGSLKHAPVAISERKGTTMIRIVLPVAEKEVPAVIAVQNADYRSPSVSA